MAEDVDDRVSFPGIEYAPRTCEGCGSEMMYATYVEGDTGLCCGNEQCERFGFRVLWLVPIQGLDERGNVVDLRPPSMR